MKILVAPDSFKGTYTAQQVAEAIADGIKQAGALPTCSPAADGGRAPTVESAAVSDSSAVVVGEGRLDRQTQSGKLISAILRRAGSVPVYAVVGSTAPDIGTYGRHFAAIHQARNPSEMRRAGAAIVDHLRADRKVTRGA